MDFYTNVCRTRDKILVTGYQGNKKQKLTVNYRPKHFIPSKKGQTPYRSLDGRYLEVVELNSMGGARKFREQYDGVKGLRYMVMIDMFTPISQTSFKARSTGTSIRLESQHSI